ncbi:hypothetical protein G6F57_017151 [Rhizopus arrhizus]|nr:hypothetical protein G6F57_017151 [Rhizopus arrhizus]
MVDQVTGERRHTEERQYLGQADQAQRERIAGDFVDVPADGDRDHLVGQHREDAVRSRRIALQLGLRGLADEGQHRRHAVAAGGREVAGQADVLDVARFGVQDLLGRAPGIHAQGQEDQAGDDGRVTDGMEAQRLRVASRRDPDHRLAAEQAVLLGLPFLREGRQLAAEVDQVLVALGPVAEEAEFLGDGGLGLGGGGFKRERGPRKQR